MNVPPAVLFPFVAVALGVASCAQAPPEDPALAAKESELRQRVRDLEQALTVARAAGLKSINVNGCELTPQHVRREAIFLVGTKVVEAQISDFFIDEWKQRVIEEGRDAKEFEISEEQLTNEIKDGVREFQVSNPGVEFWEAVRSLTGLTKEGYLQQRRQTLVFDKVFFPGPATQWPNITKEAIMASAAGDAGKQFWENIEKSAIDPESGKARELPPFWMQLCRGWVQKQLKKWSEILYPSDGLPADVVLSVNGREWKTDDAFELVRPAVVLQDIERAMAEVSIREALRQELVKQGAYLSDEDFRKEFAEYRKEFDETPFTTEVIATAFKGYPGLEAYRARWRLMRSFERMIAKEVNDDNLKAHAERFGRFFSDGQTSVDAIQFMARSVKTGAWEPDGFVRAKERAQAAWEEIHNGAAFDDVLSQRGEYYATDEAKGRFGYKSLNQLRQQLRESEFTDLLEGYSIGYYLFYDVEPGRIVGPLRGPDGYYIARVNQRTPARGATSVADERTRELVKQDYASWRFLEWSNQVLASAQIE